MWFCRIYSSQETQSIGVIIFVHELVGEFDGFPQFPVGLSIQLVSPDKNSSILLWSLKYHAVGGDPLIWFYFDDVSHFNIFALNLAASWFVDKSVCLVICLFVPFFPIQIIIGLLNKGES